MEYFDVCTLLKKKIIVVDILYQKLGNVLGLLGVTQKSSNGRA